MNQSIMIILAILFPILWGLFILLKPEFKSRKNLVCVTGIGLVVTACLAVTVLLGGDMQLTVLSLGENMDIYFPLGFILLLLRMHPFKTSFVEQ